MAGSTSGRSRALVLRGAALLLLAFAPLAVRAAQTPPINQLIMFQQEGCPFCAAWNREVGGIYRKTDEAKLLPLRRVDIHTTRPIDLRSIDGIVYTPTFVVLHCGREVQRIVGYAGKEQFWEMLDIGVQKIGPHPKNCSKG